jgi:hypothetical protein
MYNILDYPLIVFVVSLVVLWLSARGGSIFRTKRALEKEERDDLGIVVAAALTLLGLIIGFSFSMSVSRYDQRKNYETAEASAIATEYTRADVLPAADAEKVHGLLKDYLNQRILFYRTRDESQLTDIAAATERLRADLWSSIRARIVDPATPLGVQIAMGMNDVLNSQIFTQGAWWNRIPIAAWILQGLIAIGSNFLFGYCARGTAPKGTKFYFLPMLVAIAFWLIADIDSPHGGVIRIRPVNLEVLSQSLQAR